ncbi:MAG TPA: CHRD domain-containing protein [Casimicrobiaceae bacterium]
MTHRTPHALAAIAALTVLAATPASADGGGRKFSAKLIGYEETPLTINSAGRGSFTATVNQDGTIAYTLSYRDLSSPVQQAHIHFGRPAITGQIVLFLCTNLTPPSGVPLPQACPPAPATITGTLTAADVIARANQGIDAGATGLAEMVKAMRARAAYANVHTTNFPGGEIRGAVKPGDDEDED